MSNIQTLEPFSNILSEFSKLQSILSENSYIRDTTIKLALIIDDAQSNTQIIFLGNNGVGKSTLINSLLGRNVLPHVNDCPTEVNIFLKYGEVEQIEAIFFDGYTATFDLNKMDLLITSDTDIAKIIREHIQYINIYLKNDFLKNITLIDTKALEHTSDQQNVYFSDLILNRVDEIFWIIRANEGMTEQEIDLLQKISSSYMKPYVLINAIDELNGNIANFISSESNKYGSYVEQFIPISAKNAIEAKKKNQAQLLIDSNFTVYTDLVQTLTNNLEKKQRLVYKQLNEWLVRYLKEIELIPFKEPYNSSIERVKQHQQEMALEYSKKERDIAIVKTYEQDYLQCAQTFKSVETLYQLLQVIGKELFLRDETTEIFEEMATTYLQSIRSYRNLLSEYETQYANSLKKAKIAINSQNEKVVYIIEKDDRHQIQDDVVLLNEKLEVMRKVYDTIMLFESQLIEKFEMIQDYLNTLAKEKLKNILKQVSELNDQRQFEHQVIVSSSEKLKEFDCLLEAKNQLIHNIKPLVQSIDQAIDEEVKQKMIDTIVKIENVEINHKPINDELVIYDDLTTPILVEFERDYVFIPLKIRKEEFISNIPDLPLKLVVEQA